MGYNFQLISDCFVPNSKLKYEDLGNIKTDCVNSKLQSFSTVIKSNVGRFFLGTPSRHIIHHFKGNPLEVPI